MVGSDVQQQQLPSKRIRNGWDTELSNTVHSESIYQNFFIV